MSVNEMQKVYRLLRIAREQSLIPSEWIVDETRELERISTWSDPAAYAGTSGINSRYASSVWSEKGTIRGVLKPVLDQYATGFRVMHGYTSAPAVNDVAKDDEGRPLIVLHVGDLDPSGLFMSECDLPQRLADYGGIRAVRARHSPIAGAFGSDAGIRLMRRDSERTPSPDPWFHRQMLGAALRVCQGRPREAFCTSCAKASRWCDKVEAIAS